jgi:hypothetical protein
MDADLVALGTATMQGFARVEAKIDLPPMRPEASSSHEIVENVTARLAAKFRDVASDTTGPNVVASPEELTRIAQQIFAEETRKLEERKKYEHLQRDEDERKTKAEQRQSDRRQITVLAISGAIVTVLSVALTYYATKQATHDAAFVEGVKSVPALSASARGQ